MGVTGLWTVLQPVARPTKIETLNRKRLAVDASIWIYQFLKAVRDKEGNALRNSHVVGFFRRICKLLYIGIKPVFVFDGGAPALKRQTINARKKRREGRREDAVRTAGKLLAVQMQRRAEEEDRKRREERDRARVRPEQEEEVPDDAVYVEEITMTPQERQRNRKFRKTDQYHLPELDVSLAEMGGPNDPRIMSLEELEQYARQFDTGEDINVYDFSKIDFDSPFFVSLPPSDRYNILNAARLRSRLRMGYSKDQLDTMFPDRMAFSKFQIERVRERNELTQRLMNINGMNEDGMWGVNGTSRVSGEKGREYVLVKNDGVEGGWALGVVTNKEEGQRNKPIDVERLAQPARDEKESDWEEEDDFEDVPIEGLNRLPKQARSAAQTNDATDELAKRRRHLYQSRKKVAARRKRNVTNGNTDSLFVAESSSSGEQEEDEWEDIGMNGQDELFEEAGDGADAEEAELRRAIAMSLQQDGGGGLENADDGDDYGEVFQQARVDELKPFAAGSGLAVARMANARSNKAATSRPVPGSDSEDDAPDLRAALAESRRTKRKRSPGRPPSAVGKPVKEQTPMTSNASGFDGPLPFEKLDLGSSLLGRKKMKKLEEEQAGGFEKDLGGSSAKKDKSEPLPPWFAGGGGDIQSGLSRQKAAEEEDRQRERRELDEQFEFAEAPAPARLRKEETGAVIDLEAPDEVLPPTREVIDVDSSDVEAGEGGGDKEEAKGRAEVRLDGPANQVRIESPVPARQDKSLANADEGATSLAASAEEEMQGTAITSRAAAPQHKDGAGGGKGADEAEPDNEPLEWEESDREPTAEPPGADAAPARRGASKSSSPEFEDVAMGSALPLPPTASPPPALAAAAVENEEDGDLLPAGDEDEDEDDDVYSDPEDAALFQQLAEETAEHLRFASSLSANTIASAPTTAFTQASLDAELKSLRAQQRTSRRDADEVTSTMTTDVQTLLSLFGLPYLTAPMEAEAQCARLATLGLVDGVVTDDSDALLFGAPRVYRNVFNQAKYVECYLAGDVERELGLDRPALCALAELLGSDYAEGLPGVGPVTAVELLAEFGSLDGFRAWWQALQADPAAHGGIASRGAHPGESAARRRFRRAHAARLFLPPTFPDPRVADAYARPQVDDDPTPFAWGAPDLDRLRRFLMETVGWGPERADEVLVPVIRDLNRREAEGTQSNLTRWFEGGVGSGAARVAGGGEDPGGSGGAAGAVGGSRRLRGALDRVRGGGAPRSLQQAAAAGDGVGDDAEDGSREDDEEGEDPPPARKRARRAGARGRGRGRGKKRGAA